MKSIFGKVKNLTLNILFPSICVYCSENILEDQYICQKCLSSIQINSALYCPICSKRLISTSYGCNHTQDKIKEKPFLLAPASNYNNPILKELIHFYKYKKIEKISETLFSLLKQYIEIIDLESTLKSTNTILIPIPLHKSKLRSRGFNQSQLLAEKISQTYKTPISQTLIRIKNTEENAKMGEYQKRHENISGAFKVKNSNEIKNKTIILIDDVFTSGTTISEAARTLKSSGAKKIIALVIAKA